MQVVDQGRAVDFPFISACVNVFWCGACLIVQMSVSGSCSRTQSSRASESEERISRVVFPTA